MEMPMTRRRDKGTLALLAPVPLHHLRSGKEISDLHGSVLFGSDRYELFEEVEVPDGTVVYLYASKTGETPEPIVTWEGIFGGYERAEQVSANRWKLRPPSTKTDSAWVGYYEVRDLRELPPDERFRITDLTKKDGGRFSEAFIPEGPILVRA
jgi:hypothetical protein